MSNRASKRPVTKQVAKKRVISASWPEAPNPEIARANAQFALRPSVNAAAVMIAYSKPICEQDIGALTDALAVGVEDVWAGNLQLAEAMLYSQANALQAIFMNLSRRATTQEYLKQWEAHLRMALKAQNQCRMTLETLATIKNPPAVFARQANINNGGQQQVNNGNPPATPEPSARAANSKPMQSKLLEPDHDERLDTGTTGAAGGADPQLETVGAGHRPAQR